MATRAPKLEGYGYGDYGTYIQNAESQSMNIILRIKYYEDKS